MLGFLLYDLSISVLFITSTRYKSMMNELSYYQDEDMVNSINHLESNILKHKKQVETWYKNDLLSVVELKKNIKPEDVINMNENKKLPSNNKDDEHFKKLKTNKSHQLININLEPNSRKCKIINVIIVLHCADWVEDSLSFVNLTYFIFSIS
ncbi:hypothetical protein H8356DRAFT_1331693 [Neocallimastix lanati (nom. inval.)]|nr:hypothetical protein H8356DRAFT_1331693 [Neocallimastix sp. JGI-2020a]